MSSPSPALVTDLRAIVGDRLTTSASVLATHAKDESWHPPAEPDLVVYAESTDEVAAIVRVCAARGVPVIPFGAGTSLEGGVMALTGGVSLDLSRMNHVLRVSIEDLDCDVEPGITREELNAAINRDGVFFPVDPGANASIGGMASTGASGTTTVRYGTMADNILGLEVVLADGSVIRTGGRSRKTSAGYDLTRLFAGSEGTLGIITRLTLRLRPIPEVIMAATCPFPALDGAVRVVIAAIQLALPVARIELLDEVSIGAVNTADGLGLPETPTLFVEFHGTAGAVEDAARELAALVAAEGGSMERAVTRDERDRLWRARHRAYHSSLALRPGSSGWPTDVCVPISRLAQCIAESKADLEGTGLLAPLVGHVGDGNFHFVYVLDPADPDARVRAEAHYDRMIARALAMGGTCTGEHGIGYGKKAYLAQEHPTGVPVMAALKAALDPAGLLNPGKVVDGAQLFPRGTAGAATAGGSGGQH